MSLTDFQLTRPATAPAAVPRYATKRDPRRKTLGPRVVQVAKMVGYELMQWQCDVLDVALEVDEFTGKLVYREVRLTVPRQSGKTTLLLSLMTHRCIGFGARQHVMFTMQSRQDARAKLFEDYKPELEKSPLGPKLDIRESNGMERIKFPNNSRWGLTTTKSEKAGHGPTVDLGVLDEGFAQEDDVFEQAIKPSMITRGSAQFWIVSTMGTDSSTYFNEKVESGRKAAEAGEQSGVCYIEYSAPEDCDPGDHDVWYRCMPALGITVPIEAVEADYKSMKLDEFKRAYLNIKHDKRKTKGWQALSLKNWIRAADGEAEVVRDEKFVFGVDTDPERSQSSISMAGHRLYGGESIEVIDSRAGADWLFNRIEGLWENWGADMIKYFVIDKKSQAGELIPKLEAAGIPVRVFGLHEHSLACSRIYDALMDRHDLYHRGQDLLTAAAQGAIQRKYGDVWLWDRHKPNVDVTSLIAATLAYGGLVLPASDTGPIFAY